MLYRFETRGRKPHHEWGLVDWSVPTEIIAEQTGVHQGAVSRARRKYAPQTVRRTHAKTTKSTN